MSTGGDKVGVKSPYAASPMQNSFQTGSVGSLLPASTQQQQQTGPQPPMPGQVGTMLGGAPPSQTDSQSSLFTQLMEQIKSSQNGFQPVQQQQGVQLPAIPSPQPMQQGLGSLAQKNPNLRAL